jgi:hypothetical protein
MRHQFLGTARLTRVDLALMTIPVLDTESPYRSIVVDAEQSLPDQGIDDLFLGSNIRRCHGPFLSQEGRFLVGAGGRGQILPPVRIIIGLFYRNINVNSLK